MSQYNAQPDSTAESAGWEALDPELAPFLPTMDQSGGWNTTSHAGTGQPIGSKAALPPNVEFMSLHAKVNLAGICPHENVDTAVCGVCFCPFKKNNQLEQHATKNKHKAYICTCGKGFTKLSALRRHIEESTQAREHQCPLCDNKFKRPGHVEQHLRLIHKKSNDVIKSLLSAQKSVLGQEPGPASSGPTTGSIDAQADHPVLNSAEPWTGPFDLSATAPLEHPGSRPGHFSAMAPVFPAPAPATGHVSGAPGLTAHGFMAQAAELPAHPTHPIGNVATQTGLSANLDPDLVNCPASQADWNLGFVNMDQVSGAMNPADGFGMPFLDIDFTGEVFDFDIDPSTFGL